MEKILLIWVGFEKIDVELKYLKMVECLIII